MWWPRKSTIEQLLDRTNQVPADAHINKWAWQWIGNTWRKPYTSWTSEALKWNPQGQTKQGDRFKLEKSKAEGITHDRQDLGLSKENSPKQSETETIWLQSNIYQRYSIKNLIYLTHHNWLYSSEPCLNFVLCIFRYKFDQSYGVF